MDNDSPARLEQTSERFTMRGARKWSLLGGFLVLAGGISAAVIPNLFPFRDATGVVSTYNVNGPINESGDGNPFFESLGTNGRSCGTCHIAENSFGLSAQNAQERFGATRGKDPLFASVDGANCPTTTVGNPAEHSLLLKSGLIRVFLPVPATAQFTITPVHDPYGCASVTDSSTGVQTVSVYRRPLPTTNLHFLSTVMFDGRETVEPLNKASTFQANLTTDLLHQSIDATLTHAQALNPPTTEQQNAIVSFELGLFTAQIADDQAGMLNAHGAQGGALNLSNAEYYPGINDVLGADPHGNAFNPVAFTLFDSWTNIQARGPLADFRDAVRRKIAAGENLFNTRALIISNVRGLNDNAALGTTPVPPFQGNCTTCHDTPNVGDHSLPLPLDIGTGHPLAQETDPLIANAVSQLDFPDLPVYKITGCPNPFAGSQPSAEPFIIYTTDPGKGLISGLCSDVNRVKGPILRGLAARAPYFHNGAAHDLNELLNFYNQRFQMNLTEEEKSELIAFLNSL
jgi:cytochrome c peroxidase